MEDSIGFVEDKTMLLHWNPHIFPTEVNNENIQSLRINLEKEISTSRNPRKYSEFAGIEEHEFDPILIIKPENTRIFLILNDIQMI